MPGWCRTACCRNQWEPKATHWLYELLICSPALLGSSFCRNGESVGLSSHTSQTGSRATCEQGHPVQGTETLQSTCSQVQSATGTWVNAKDLEPPRMDGRPRELRQWLLDCHCINLAHRHFPVVTRADNSGNTVEETLTRTTRTGVWVACFSYIACLANCFPTVVGMFF